MDGTEVIDGLSGLWNVNVGQGRRELAEAAMDQMSTLAYCSSYTGASNLPVIKLAERLSHYAYPSINSFYFTSGGPSRRRVRLKPRAFTGKFRASRTKLKSFRGKLGYHGLTMAAMSATGMPEYWQMFGPLVPNFVHIESPYPYRFEGGDANTSPVSLPRISLRKPSCMKARTR